MPGDIVTLNSGGATGIFSNKNVGIGKIVTITGFTLIGTNAGAYSLIAQPSTTADITALDITGSFTASDKTYDGDNSTTVLTRSLTGVLAADAANVSLTGGTATSSDKNVANRKNSYINRCNSYWDSIR